MTPVIIPYVEHLNKIELYNAASEISCECEALVHRKKAIYGQFNLNLEEYDKHPTKYMYKLVQGIRMLAHKAAMFPIDFVRTCDSIYLRSNGV